MRGSLEMFLERLTQFGARFPFVEPRRRLLLRQLRELRPSFHPDPVRRRLDLDQQSTPIHPHEVRCVRLLRFEARYSAPECSDLLHQVLLRRQERLVIELAMVQKLAHERGCSRPARREGYRPLFACQLIGESLLQFQQSAGGERGSVSGSLGRKPRLGRNRKDARRAVGSELFLENVRKERQSDVPLVGDRRSTLLRAKYTLGMRRCTLSRYPSSTSVIGGSGERTNMPTSQSVRTASAVREL